MKLAIIGSRNFNDKVFFLEKVKDVISEYNITAIISGGAVGTDLLGKQYALDNQIEYIEFLPDWSKYNRAAGMVRNRDIVNNSDIVLAFWDGVSKGTKNSIDFAKKQNKILFVVYTKNDKIQ